MEDIRVFIQVFAKNWEMGFQYSKKGNKEKSGNDTNANQILREEPSMLLILW